LRRHGTGAHRYLGAELLARHHADPPRLGEAGLAASLGVRAALRGRLGEPEAHDHAGVRARHRPGGGADAAAALVDAGRAAAGLRAHRQGEGPPRRRRGRPPRGAQRADPRRHDPRPAARGAALGRRAHGAGLHDPRLRQAGGGRRVQPRLRRGAGRGAHHRHRLHPHQPARGRRVRRPGPADRREVTVGALPATGSGAGEAPARGPLGRPPRRLLRRPPAVIGALVVAVFVAVAALAPWLAPFDPARPDFLAVRQPPSAEHPFGTDEIGRDVLSRTLYGARASLVAGVISVAIAVGVGVPLGLLSGYYRGALDELIMRLTDAVLSFPFLILAIALAAALGPSLTNAMIAIGIATTPTFVRLTRAQVLAVGAEDYVQAARALGASDARVIARHVFPNSFAPLLVQATLTIAQAVIAESALSFLGLGVQPPTPSWGGMLNTAKNFLVQAPWMAVFPGLSIFLTVLAF